MIDKVMIIDVGLGNSGSVSNMLKYLGIDHFRSNKKKDLESASKIILPGVGSFDSGLRALKEAELIEYLQQLNYELIKRKKHYTTHLFSDVICVDYLFEK